MYHLDQPSYPDIESDSDMVCPNCKDPYWGAHVYEMETEYDGDEGGVYRNDYVTQWQCENCDHVFMPDEALSMDGVIEDEETPDDMRETFKRAKAQLVKWAEDHS